MMELFLARCNLVKDICYRNAVNYFDIEVN